MVKKSSSVVIPAQSLNETIGGSLHIDEVVAQRAGAVKHEHDHRALVLVDDFGVARRLKLAVKLPL